MKRALLVLTLLTAAAPVHGQERITGYHTEVRIRTDGAIDVTERITVRAEGNQIRRGIYRDFPTRYRDRHGNRVVVGFEVLAVERNGQPEPWFTERVSNGIRINTGNDDFLQVPAEYTFTLQYRTTRQLGFFSDHDELYWNATGNGWIFPIQLASVEVRLPAAVPPDEMRPEGYTGYQGATEQAYVAELPSPGVARYRTTRPLQPQQGLTVVLAFPKGIVQEPSRAQQVRWLLADNRGVLIGLAGLLILLLYCVREWRLVGRDPKPGVIIARYQPPADHTPASLRFVRRMGYDTRCFSADVLDMAVAGHLRINRHKKTFSEEWTLERTAAPGSAATAAADTARYVTSAAAQPGMPTHVRRALAGTQLALLNRLFGRGRSTLTLKNTNAEIVQAAQSAHRKALDLELNRRYFIRNIPSVVIAVAIAAATGFAAFVASGGAGLALLFAVYGLMAVALLVFAHLVRAPTRQGRALLDEIEGLKLYLRVAERDELAGMRGPDAPPALDADRYESLLPYAVALEVEDAWTKKFTAAVGAAAAAEAARRMTWYGGGGHRDLAGFSRAIGSSLNAQISSSSRPPGSSSGSGGGGSSGGGGGGGGGGGR